MAITQEYLKSILSYNPENGFFKWKKRKAICINIGDKAGCFNQRGYFVIRIDGINYYAHRLAWIYVYGDFTSEIDHINLDKGDNRICNLRKADRFENSHNKGLQKNNTSGFKGVWCERGKWRARIKINNNQVNLGSYDTKEQASCAYKEAAERLHGQFARFE